MPPDGGVVILAGGTSLSASAGKRAVKAVPSKKLFGKPSRTVSVRLRVIATDRGGNATRTDKIITVKPDPKGKKRTR